jgi:hypothetical protein
MHMMNERLGRQTEGGDAAVSLFWELHGLGLGDRGHVRRAEAEWHVADIDLVRGRNRYAASFPACQY